MVLWQSGYFSVCKTADTREIHKNSMVLWRSGYAAVCKTAYTGSIPVGTSIIILLARRASRIIINNPDRK